MLTVAEAQVAILDECEPLAGRVRSIGELDGLVLAEEIVSEVDLPPFDKSMMDGYALRAADVTTAGERLRVVGELTAGRTFEGHLEAGTAVRIMTGAPLPAGADAVVRFEDTTAAGDEVVINLSRVAVEANVIRRGENLRAGAPVMSAGRRLRPQDISLLAEIGRGAAVVRPRPTAAVLATGDELVPPGEPLGPGQICNSTEVLLLAQLRGWGCEATGLGIARDDKQQLRDRIEAGLSADMLLLTGGVSMGTLDLVPQVLAELGVRQVFHKVAMKPGKPMWFGVGEAGASSGGRTLIFALPGNPVSTMVCSEMFVRPAIGRLVGSNSPVPPRLPARLVREHRSRDSRPTFFPAWLECDASGWTATPTAWRGSSDVRSTADANALIAFPAGERTYAAGETVEVIPFRDAVGTAHLGLNV